METFLVSLISIAYRFPKNGYSTLMVSNYLARASLCDSDSKQQVFVRFQQLFRVGKVFRDLGKSRVPNVNKSNVFLPHFVFGSDQGRFPV